MYTDFRLLTSDAVYLLIDATYQTSNVQRNALVDVCDWKVRNWLK